MYRADAFPLALSVTRPTEERFAFGGALPSIGGHARGLSKAQKHGIVRFEQASWRVEGEQRNAGTYETVASAEITGLRILDTFSVDELFVEARGYYQGGVGKTRYPDVRLQHCVVQGVFVSGHKRGSLGGVHEIDDPDDLARLADTNDVRRISIPDFGTVYYGHVRRNDHEFEVSALRVELGSPVKGVVLGASVRVDGNWYP